MGPLGTMHSLMRNNFSIFFALLRKLNFHCSMAKLRKVKKKYTKIVSHQRVHGTKRPHVSTFLLAFWVETKRKLPKIRNIRKNIRQKQKLSDHHNFGNKNDKKQFFYWKKVQIEQPKCQAVRLCVAVSKWWAGGGQKEICRPEKSV